MAKKVEITIEEKLRALFDLQLIDSRIDEIRNIRGELPLEVEDLENEIEGSNVKVDKITSEIVEFESNITNHKNSIEEAKALIEKYSDKLNNVRNNREYNSIVKEEEFQKLEIELCEKKIKDLQAKSELKSETIKNLQEHIQEKQKHLDAKKSELKEIMKETEKEENLLIEQSNGMAIVALERGASAGSYFTIPPQIQMEIASRQRIITDEYSGRILVDAELANEEKDKINKLINSL